MARLDELVNSVLGHAESARLDGALVLFDPFSNEISGGLIVACPECSNYNQIAIMLRELADKLDVEAMTREPCGRHAKRN